MSVTNDIFALEKEGLIEKAYYAYKNKIDSRTASEDDFINALVIAFISQDMGSVSKYSVTQEFVDMMWDEIDVLISIANEQSLKSDEFHFWKRYIKLILLGEQDETLYDDCLKAVLDGQNYCSFYLKSSVDEVKEVGAQLQKLRAVVDKGHTAKHRYVKSILTY